MRMIGLDEVMQIVRDNEKMNPFIPHDDCGSGWYLAHTDLMKRLRTCQTIEAEPVKHGKWIHCNGTTDLWYCSECGEKIRYNPKRRVYNIIKRRVHEINKRCRSCGAIMDKEDT